MLRRKLFDFLRKTPVLKTVKAADYNSTQRYQLALDGIRLTEKLAVDLDTSPTENLTLQDFVVAISAYLALDDINLEEVVAALLEETGIHHAVIEEHLTLSDYITHTWGEWGIDTLTLSDTMLYELSYVTERSETVTDSVNLSDIASFVLESLQTIADSISVSDFVEYETASADEQGSRHMLIPDGYAVYNYNFVQVSGNLSVWWDGDTSTSFTIYFSPSAPNNPHLVFLFFVDYAPTITRFRIFVSSLTAGKSLVIEVFDFAGYPIYTTTVPLAAGQWITVEPNIPLVDVGQIAVYTDSNIVGFVEIAEFQAYISGSGN